MYKWIKSLVDAYENMFVVKLPKKPVVYKIGDRRYVRTKRISKKTIGRVKYIKNKEE